MRNPAPDQLSMKTDGSIGVIVDRLLPECEDFADVYVGAKGANTDGLRPIERTVGRLD